MELRDTPQCAFVLRIRAYRESSLLVDCFTREHGRLTAVARGAKRPKSAFRGRLEPFQSILITASGRGDLLTLRTAELAECGAPLTGLALFCGFYLNELLLRVLRGGVAFPNLFNQYQETIQTLRSKSIDSKQIERILRYFEFDLLSELGYGLQLTHEIGSETPLDPDGAYIYDFERGPVPAIASPDKSLYYQGQSLLALNSRRLERDEDLRAAKKILRHGLALIIGDKPLQSRLLLKQFYQTQEESG